MYDVATSEKCEKEPRTKLGFVNFSISLEKHGGDTGSSQEAGSWGSSHLRRKGCRRRAGCLARGARSGRASGVRGRADSTRRRAGGARGGARGRLANAGSRLRSPRSRTGGGSTCATNSENGGSSRGGDGRVAAGDGSGERRSGDGARRLGGRAALSGGARSRAGGRAGGRASGRASGRRGTRDDGGRNVDTSGSTVGHTVRNDSIGDVGATSLLRAVAQTKAEVGVLAKAGGVRLAVDRGAAQIGLLLEHVLNAGLAALGDGADVLGMNGTKEGTGEDGDRLHLDCWFLVLGWWVGGLIVAAR